MKSYMNYFKKERTAMCIDLSEYTVQEFIEYNKKARYMGETKRFIKDKKSLVVLYYVGDMLDRVVEYPYSEFKQNRKGNESKEDE